MREAEEAKRGMGRRYFTKGVPINNIHTPHYGYMRVQGYMQSSPMRDARELEGDAFFSCLTCKCSLLGYE